MNLILLYLVIFIAFSEEYKWIMLQWEYEKLFFAYEMRKVPVVFMKVYIKNFVKFYGGNSIKIFQNIFRKTGHLCLMILFGFPDP